MVAFARVQASLCRGVGIGGLLTMIACASPQSAGDTPTVAIIVHPSNTTGALTTHQLRRIFLRHERTWPASSGLGGRRIIPVDLVRQDPAREVFSRAVFQGGTDFVRQLWIAEGLKNGSEAPAQRPASKVLAIVGRTRNAIGYVSARMVSKAVRVIGTL